MENDKRLIGLAQIGMSTRAIYPHSRIKTEDSHIQVMAFEQGYVMAKWKGCMPFVKSKRDFIKIIEKYGIDK